jgi:hypothetical protein
MKKLLLPIITLLLISCSDSKVNDVASFEFNGAWYWIIQYKPGATKQEIEDYVKLWANPNQTSFFYVYDDSMDLSAYKTQAYNLNSFTATVLANKPKYGYYKIPTETKLNTDAIWLLEQSTKTN